MELTFEQRPGKQRKLEASECSGPKSALEWYSQALSDSRSDAPSTASTCSHWEPERIIRASQEVRDDARSRGESCQDLEEMIPRYQERKLRQGPDGAQGRWAVVPGPISLASPSPHSQQVKAGLPLLASEPAPLLTFPAVWTAHNTCPVIQVQLIVSTSVPPSSLVLPSGCPGEHMWGCTAQPVRKSSFTANSLPWSAAGPFCMGLE